MKPIRYTPLLAAGLFALRVAWADLGPLPDPTWGSPGSDSTVYVGFDLTGNNYDRATSALIQPDGKLVMAGLALAVNTPGSQYDTALARLNASDGSLDSSFGGGDGRHNLGIVPSANARIAQDANGKLLVTVGQNEPSALLARLNEDGSFDTSFDQDGRKFVSAGNFLDGAGTISTTPFLLPLAGGKYLVLTSVYRPGPPLVICVAAIRLNANGSLDPSFAGGVGRVCEAPAYETLNAAQVLSVATAGDGDLLLAGAAYHSGSSVYDMSVLKLSTDGVRDIGFGEDGWAFAPFDEGGNLIDFASAIAVDMQGRILLGGSTSVSNFATAAAIARFTSAGQLDPSFDEDGRLLMDLGPISTNSTYQIVRIEILGTERILLAGVADEGSFLAMLTDVGAFNPEFGSAGRFISPRGTNADMSWNGDYVYSVGRGTNPATNRVVFAATRRIIPLFRSGFD
jgi:uncharacterized delta-60 repeat protein